MTTAGQQSTVLIPEVRGLWVWIAMPYVLGAGLFAFLELAALTRPEAAGPQPQPLGFGVLLGAFGPLGTLTLGLVVAARDASAAFGRRVDAESSVTGIVDAEDIRLERRLILTSGLAVVTTATAVLVVLLVVTGRGLALAPEEVALAVLLAVAVIGVGTSVNDAMGSSYDRLHHIETVRTRERISRWTAAATEWSAGPRPRSLRLRVSIAVGVSMSAVVAALTSGTVTFRGATLAAAVSASVVTVFLCGVVVRSYTAFARSELTTWVLIMGPLAVLTLLMDTVLVVLAVMLHEGVEAGVRTSVLGVLAILLSLGLVYGGLGWKRGPCQFLRFVVSNHLVDAAAAETARLQRLSDPSWTVRQQRWHQFSARMTGRAWQADVGSPQLPRSRRRPQDAEDEGPRVVDVDGCS